MKGARQNSGWRESSQGGAGGLHDQHHNAGSDDGCSCCLGWLGLLLVVAATNDNSVEDKEERGIRVRVARIGGVRLYLIWDGELRSISQFLLYMLAK